MDMSLASPEDRYLDSRNCYLPSDHKTVWFKASFDNRTCIEMNVDATFYGSVSIWRDSCLDSLSSCDDQDWFDYSNINEYKASMSFVAEMGEEYNIVIAAENRNHMDFTLSLESIACGESDTCETAAVIAEFPYTSMMSTTFSTSEDRYVSPAYACGSLSSGSHTNWYILPKEENPGTCLTIFVSASFRTFIGVYAGEGCEDDSLSCLVQERSGDGLLQVAVPPNRTLYVIVGGAYSYESGDYMLSVDVS